MSQQTSGKSRSGRSRSRRNGRGAGSGRGKTCGRGQKGQGARTGGPARPTLFEGGQNPFWKRLPCRGFTNARHTRRYQTVSLDRALERVEGDTLDLEQLAVAGLIQPGERIKLVSGVETGRTLSVAVHRVTASVRRAVEAAGGTVEEIDGR